MKLNQCFYIGVIWAFLCLGGCAGKKVDLTDPKDKRVKREVPEAFRDGYDVKKTKPKKASPKTRASQDSTTSQKKPSQNKKTVSEKNEDSEKKDQSSSETSIQAQKEKQSFEYPHRHPEKQTSFQVGEKLLYEMTYFGIPAGTAQLKTLPLKEIKDRKVYHFRADFKSSGVVSTLYSDIDDYIESYWDTKGLFSHRYQMVSDHSGSSRHSLTLLNSKKRKVFYFDRWDREEKGYQEKKKTYQMPRFPQDSLSAMYYIRALPLEVGSKVKIPVVDGDEVKKVIIRVLRKTTIHNEALGKVKAIVLNPRIKEKGKLKKRSKKNRVWVTADDHILVRIEAKVKIGYVKGHLEKMKRGTPPSS